MVFHLTIPDRNRHSLYGIQRSLQQEEQPTGKGSSDFCRWNQTFISHRILAIKSSNLCTEIVIDQSQSFNVHIAEPNFGKLTSMHFYAWKKVWEEGRLTGLNTYISKYGYKAREPENEWCWDLYKVSVQWEPRHLVPFLGSPIMGYCFLDWDVLLAYLTSCQRHPVHRKPQNNPAIEDLLYMSGYRGLFRTWRHMRAVH